MKTMAISLGLALAPIASTTLAQPPFGQGPNASCATEFIILGTASGPNSESDRAQPANALLAGGQLYLVDAGDGAVAQMAKAGLRIGGVRGVFLSHLHFDHIGGMLAVIGLRAQLGTPARRLSTGHPGRRSWWTGCSWRPVRACVPAGDSRARTGRPMS
jgi:glyoxylase-like metal-dependent hydrolase (beta-lactamase superfamily II)